MDIVTFNSEAINWKRGLWTTLVLFGALAVIIFFKLPLALWAGAGGLAVGLVYFDAPLKDRLKFALEITIIGAIMLAFMLALAGMPPAVSPVQSALVLAIAIFAIGIMQSLGGPWIIVGFLLGILAYQAVLAANAAIYPAGTSAISYLIGGLIATGVVWVLHALFGEPHVDVEIKSLENVPARTLKRLNPTNYWFQFALVRAIAVFIAVWIGLTYFGSRWLWLSIIPFILITPAWPLTMLSTVRRLVGNLIGFAIMGVIGLLIAPNMTIDLVLFLIATFIAFSFIGTGTVPMVVVWTVWALAMERLVNPQPFLSDIIGTRFLAIAIGAVIALVAAWILTKLRKARVQDDGTD